MLLGLSIIAAVVLFSKGSNYPPLHDLLVSMGYLGSFIGGFFYAYGFTSAPATTLLLVLAKEQNILIAGLIGGIGALISDILIFFFVRQSFNDELRKIQKEKTVRSFRKAGKNFLGSFYKYLLPIFAGFIIASPLPTEIGVSLMASLKNLSIRKFILFAYILHTIGILIILTIGINI